MDLQLKSTALDHICPTFFAAGRIASLVKSEILKWAARVLHYFVKLKNPGFSRKKVFIAL